MTKISDLSDPTRPRFIRDFGLVGQEPGSTGVAPAGVHGPLAFRNRVDLAYRTGAKRPRLRRRRGTGASGGLQLVRRAGRLAGDSQAAARFAPAADNLPYPQIGRL